MKCEICEYNNAIIRIGHKCINRNSFKYVNVCEKYYQFNIKEINKLLYTKIRSK